MAGLNDNFTFFMCTPYPTIILLEFVLTTQEQDNIPEDLYNIFSQAKSFMLGTRDRGLKHMSEKVDNSDHKHPYFCHVLLVTNR